MHLKLTKHGRFYKQNNQLPTKNHDELKDNSTMPRNLPDTDRRENQPLVTDEPVEVGEITGGCSSRLQENQPIISKLSEYTSNF